MTKQWIAAASLLSFLAVAGCDGGSGDMAPAPSPSPSPAPSPSPGQTPSPTPSPTSTSGAYLSFDALTTDRSFAYASIRMFRAQTERGPYGYVRDPKLRQSYTAASQQWSFTNGSLTFSPADIVETTPELVRYFKPKADGTVEPEWDNSLTLYNPAIGAARLHYMRAYRLVDPITAAFGPPYSMAPSINFGVIGDPTRANDALAGTLNYTLRIFGVVLSADGYAQRYDLAGSTGTASITPQGKITTALNLVGTPLGGGAAVAFGTFTTTGNVSAIDVGFDSGLARGTFFGPNGREIGAAFRVNVGSDRYTAGIAIGSIVGVQD